MVLLLIILLVLGICALAWAKGDDSPKASVALLLYPVVCVGCIYLFGVINDWIDQPSPSQKVTVDSISYSPTPIVTVEPSATPTPTYASHSSSSSGGSTSRNRDRSVDDIKSDPNTIVYITETGIKYHSIGCGSLSKSCYEITLYDAVDRGYDSCDRCHPPE